MSQNVFFLLILYKIEVLNCVSRSNRKIFFKLSRKFDHSLIFRLKKGFLNRFSHCIFTHCIRSKFTDQFKNSILHFP